MGFLRNTKYIAAVTLLFALATSAAAAPPRSAAVVARSAGLSSSDAAATSAAAAVLSCKIDSTPDINPILESEYSLVRGGINTTKLWEQNAAETARVAQALRADYIITIRVSSASAPKAQVEAIIATIHNGKPAFQKIKLGIPAKDIHSFQKTIVSELLEKLSPGTGKTIASSLPYTSNRSAFISFGQAIVESEQGRAAAALKSFAAAEREDRNFRDLHFYLGKYHATKQFDYEKALSYMNKVADKYPSDAGAQYWLGFTYYLKGDTARSIRAFETSIKLKPRQPDAYAYLAVLYKDRAQLDKVEAYYLKSLDMSPGNPAAWYNLAAVQSIMGKTPESLASLSKALDLDCSSFLPIVKNDADFINARKKPEFSKTIADYSRKCQK